MQAISRNVYNMNCTLFSQPDYQKITSYVQQFLLRNSKSANSLVCRTERRGWYKLNASGSADARQLILQFKEYKMEDEQEKQEKEMPQQDLSLNLFDF